MVALDWHGLGRRVASARALLGWTQEELALQADTSQRTVSQVEQGRYKQLAVPILVGLSEALNITLPYLVYGHDPRPPRGA